MVLCKKPGDARNNEERLYLFEASQLKAHSVLFRRHYKDSDADSPYRSEPAVCIFREEDIEFNSEDHIKLHAKLWSAGKNEIYLLVGRNRIDVINARRPADIDAAGKLSTSKIRLAEVLKGDNDERFSAYLFGSGTFWEQSDFNETLNEGSSPYIHLLTYLMAVRKRFLNNAIDLTENTIDKLLIVSILVKFLEEIKDSDGKHTLKTIYRRLKVTNFVEAVDAGLLLDVLNELASEFNGKLFDNFTDVERKKIKNTNLALLSQFLTAKIDLFTSQLFLWEQYNFNHLPAEVISAIYENFIQAEATRKNGQSEKGVVYTPIHLVNFLVDETMPLDQPHLFNNLSFKVLDPSCGSGVFLVAAYKRLLQWWAINNSTKNNIQYPSAKIAKKILEENIFGVDVKETAILISILGLTTALLDKLSPKEIWNQLKFPNLREDNLQATNFFKWAGKIKQSEQTFDLVIGNPPFNPETGSNKHTVIASNLIDKLEFKHRQIPRLNFALHFFEGSMSLAKRVCMIIPSNVLLYDKASMKYRKLLFKDYTVSDIYDFTHLRRDLFHNSADTPVVAVIAQNRPAKGEKINHTVVKRMVQSENRIRFEIDYYDKHLVPLDWALDEEKQFIWKTNLLGGERLFHFINRLSALPSLESYISKKKGWQEIRGFEGGSKLALKNVDRIIGIRDDGQAVVSIDVNITTNALKDKFMYEPPFMIIDQVLGDKTLPVAFVGKRNIYTKKSNLYYSRDFIGISVPDKDEQELRQIFDFLTEKNQSRLNYQAYILAKSSSSLVLTETDVNKSEILSVPYPENREYLELSKSEAIIQDDVLKYYVHLGKSINNNAAGRIFRDNPNETQLADYGRTFCDTLNAIYEKDGKAWQVAGFQKLPSFIACQICFGPKTDGLAIKLSDSSQSTLAELFKDSTINRGAIYSRVVRIYKHINDYDCVFIVKPNALRYWLRSIALRDADDTFVDLTQEGF